MVGVQEQDEKEAAGSFSSFLLGRSILGSKREKSDVNNDGG